MSEFITIAIVFIAMVLILPLVFPLVELYVMYCKKLWDFCER